METDMKPLHGKDICQMARDYLSRLLEDGEITEIPSEQATIDWLCGDCESKQADCVRPEWQL
jgi:hypothetical protein